MILLEEASRGELVLGYEFQYFNNLLSHEETSTSGSHEDFLAFQLDYLSAAGFLVGSRDPNTTNFLS